MTGAKKMHAIEKRRSTLAKEQQSLILVGGNHSETKYLFEVKNYPESTRLPMAHSMLRSATVE